MNYIWQTVRYSILMASKEIRKKLFEKMCIDG